MYNIGHHFLLLSLASALCVGCGHPNPHHASFPDAGPGDTLGVESNDAVPQSGPEPPIVLTIDLHVDPLPQAAPVEERRKTFHERLGNAEWLLDTLEGTGAKITFLAGPEFYEYCLEDEEREACFEILQRLYDSGGSLGTHTHQEVKKGVHDWPGLPGTASPEQCHQSWADAVEMTNAAISALMGLTDVDDIMAVNNIHGSHLPKDDWHYDELMMAFGFDVLESGPEEDFYGLYGHHIWNVYRPSPDNWMTEDSNTQYVLVPSGPVIGRVGVHKGVMQDMSVPHVQTMFLQLLANWQHRVATNAPDKMWTFGVAMHAYDISEGSQVRDAIVSFVDWANTHFVGKSTPEGYPIARWDGRAALAKDFESWETNHPESVAFQYPSTERNDALYPYLLPIAAQLQDAYFTQTLSLGTGVSAYQFDVKDEPVVMLWGQSNENIAVDLSPVFSQSPTIVVTDSASGETTQYPTTTVPVSPTAVIIGYKAPDRESIAPQTNPSSAGSCGDGVCGPKEQANPTLCAQDCR